MDVPFSRPDIGDLEKKAIEQVLDSTYLQMGKETIAFEREFARYIGAKYAIAVNSCTSALFLALKVLGVKEGDEVIVPSFTFTSSAAVILHCNATPVFADVNYDDFTLDQKSVESVITKRTKAVIPVHYAGVRAKIKTSLPVIEDSAHLIPKGGDNKNSFARCYSFYTTKNMTTVDGGVITVNSKKESEWLIKARLHGLSSSAWKRYTDKSNWKYSVEFPGYKFNLTDIDSALGRVQLKRLVQFEKRRKRVVNLYNKLLGLNNKGTHLYPILVKDKNRFMKYMRENGVGCSFHFPPLHLQPAYKRFRRKKLPVTEYVGERVVTLPLDAVISDKEVEYVATLVKRNPGFK